MRDFQTSIVSTGCSISHDEKYDGTERQAKNATLLF
jgi:hypothetical protein